MARLQCPTCQTAFDPGDRFCRACGATLPDGAAKSPTPQPPPSSAPNPQSKQSPQQERPRAGGNWQEYKNVWYGFALEKPVNWDVHTANGVITVCQDPEELTSVSIRQLQLQKRLPAETVARHLVGAMQKIIPSLTAWSVPPVEGETPDPATLVMHTQASFKNIPMKGIFIVQVNDDIALISSYQAPAQNFAQIRPTLQQILASVHFIEPIPRQKYVESTERAYSGYAPQGWQVHAMIRRTPDATRLPLVDFKATAPGGQISLEVPLFYQQYTENPAAMMMPGPIRYMPIVPAMQYAQQILVPQLRQRYRDLKIEATRQHANLSQQETTKAQQRDNFGLGTSCDVGSIQYTFSNNGVLYRSKDYVQIDRMQALGLWTARVTAKLRAPAEQFADNEPIFIGMVESSQPDPQWAKNEQARGDAMFQQARGRLARVQQQQVAAFQNLQNVQLDIAETMREGTNRRNRQFSALQNDFDRIIQGRTYLFDAIDNRVYDVEMRPGSYWAGDGYVYNSNSPNTPKIGLHRLDPL